MREVLVDVNDPTKEDVDEDEKLEADSDELREDDVDSELCGKGMSAAGWIQDGRCHSQMSCLN